MLKLSSADDVLQNSPHMGKPALASSKMVCIQCQDFLPCRGRKLLKLVQWANRRDPNQPIPKMEKPTGYSLFRYELMATPKSWAEKTHNLVSYNQHERGGHFAVSYRQGVIFHDVLRSY